MAEATRFNLYLDILRVLDQLRIPYVVIGAFAGMSYGVTRMTADVDIVVELNELQMHALADAFPLPRYYADPEQMKNSTRLGIMFNIIDSSEGRKADLIPTTMKPGYAFALERRIRREIPLKGAQTFQAWFARPDDIIIGKLMVWNEGRSAKHEQDIRAILFAIKSNEDPELVNIFDEAEVNRWAIELGIDVLEFWRRMKTEAGFE
ncbi:MAG: hypothetical protein HY257_12400 [Chloroflexi bacterium]|nr:hypothetical protein [Chloroflexota bacterium]